MQHAPSARVRFGGFELHLISGELSHGDGKVLLQEQPLQVLRMLIARDGDLVTREEIKSKLWPNDTIVEFDQSINAVIRNLRKALGDSADQPAYIETLARRGYRLKVPVEWIAEPSDEVVEVGDGVAARMQPEPSLIGQKVSHYRALEVIGGGGMGMVYRAEDLKLGRQVALKFLPPELAWDAVALQRFEREARAASSLDHPNICTIYEVEEHEGQPFLVMQLLQGETLRDRLSHFAQANQKIAINELLDISVQICDGLQAAHAKGIIHRDIKPANIFLTTSGQVKILDFGLAKLVGVAEQSGSDGLQLQPDSSPAAPQPAPSNLPDATLTRFGTALGTAGYMSPEQVRGEKLDPRTDIFSFGLVLYEMATGQRAFTGETAAVVHDAILKRLPIPIHNLNPSVAPRLEQIVGKALEKDRERRYQSATKVGSDLRSLAADRPAPVAEVSARRHQRLAGLMATLSGVPWWTWFVAASFVACFFVGFLYLPFELPEDTGIGFALSGARVMSVAPGTPAERAGFKKDDEIVNVDGRAVHNTFEAGSALSNTVFDHPVSVVALRGGKELHLQLVLQRTLFRSYNKREKLGLWVASTVSLMQLLVGLIVLFKRPRDLTAVAAGIFLCTLGTGEIAFYSPGVAGPWRSLPLVIQWLAFPAVNLSPIGEPVPSMLLFAVFFPKPPLHRRWAWTLLAVLDGPLLAAWITGEYLTLFSPSGPVGVVPPWVPLVTAVACLLAFLASVVILTVNYFTLREVNEKRRIRLVVFGLLIVLANVLASVLFTLWQKTFWLSQLCSSLFVVGMVQIPFTICVAYAVLQQRMFDVRLIVRQSLQYAIARGALLLPIPIVAGILIFDLITHKGQPFGTLLSAHGWAYALLVVAALVAHAKRSQWMEALDRRFYREQYDAQRLLRQTVDQIRASSNVADVVPKVVAQLEQALHPEFVAILMRERRGPGFRSIASAPPGVQPHGLRAESKLMAAFRLFAKPLQTSAGESGWLWQQLPREDTNFLHDAHIDLMVPIAIAPHGPEALMVLGPKKSEEPYGSEDQELLSGIGSALDLLLHRPRSSDRAG